MAKKAKRDAKGCREARRAERLHDRLAAAERRVAKRIDLLAEAVARRDSLAARLAAPATGPTPADAGRIEPGAAPAETAVRADASPARETASAAPVQAFCLRERRRVDILNPVPIVLSNGRPAIAGTCPSCGVRVVRTGPRPG